MKMKPKLAALLRRWATRLNPPEPFVQRRRRKTKWMPKVKRRMARESQRRNRRK